MDLITLKEFYEGIGANTKATLSADSDLQDMFYAGEKEAPTHVVGQV